MHIYIICYASESVLGTEDSTTNDTQVDLWQHTTVLLTYQRETGTREESEVTLVLI